MASFQSIVRCPLILHNKHPRYKQTKALIEKYEKYAKLNQPSDAPSIPTNNSVICIYYKIKLNMKYIPTTMLFAYDVSSCSTQHSLPFHLPYDSARSN